jgi:hypothetical protein
MGVKIRRYRAGSIGASLTIQPVDRGGTLVACILVTGQIAKAGKARPRPRKTR